ncbi:putative bifunctional diguanylate cyclase/phosphodiesterase [Thiohalorhabdus sp.]|uniref:putative bifunctional diguanylate cyclase/phosphodiesterase n=1 Tax=Thiohalorhabdus sp. TaxID=3094134 RepID=UPI002FC38C17
MPHFPFLAAAKRGLDSLSGRYLLGALLLLGFLGGSAWVAWKYLEGERAEHYTHLRQRQEALSHLQIIRSALWTVEHNLQAFALTPEKSHRARAIMAIRNGRDQAQELTTLSWTRRLNQRDRARQVADQFAQLEEAARKLIAIRKEPDRLYPGLGIRRETLGPTNRRFLVASQRGLTALESNATNSQSSALFRRAQFYWSRMVSEFRLFMTARIGLLSGSQDLNRKANLENYHQAVRGTLSELEALHDEKGLGLVADRALSRMRELEQDWFAGFREVAGLSANRNWRADFPLITDALYPRYEAIQGELQSISRTLEENARQENASLFRAAQNIAVFPWALTGVHLIVIALGFLYLRRRVLGPLSRLARALRHGAEGQPAALALIGGPSEIRDLSNAFRSMRQEVRARQGELEHQAFHDPLTGLPNRALLEDRLNQGALRSHRNGTSGALIMMDLDYFKEINDTFGHPAGDAVLKGVAGRLTGELREADTVARFGGDEFGILLPTTNSDYAPAIGERLLAALRPRMEVDAHSFHVSGSLGIALFPAHGADAETLIRRADRAMYQAKEKRQSWAIARPHKDDDAPERLTQTAELYEDLLQDRLPLHYQPQWDLASGQLSGGEALLRWSPAEGGPVTPPEVLAMAHRAGIPHELTRCILHTSMREAGAWQRTDRPRLSVNLSTDDLQVDEFPTFIRQELDAWEIPSECLELEVTENDMMADPERARLVLGELRALGVRIAIDDYGTGYSSLGYLRGLPADILKIDKSFIMDLATSTDNQAIVRSTVELGHNLGLKVVAEGVEDAASLELIRQCGCDRAQGFFLGHPVPPERFRA